MNRHIAGMFRIGLAALICAVFLAGGSGVAEALPSASTPSTVTLAPPPLAYPDYSEPGKLQSKAGFVYASITGTDLNLTALGLSYTGRWVLEPTFGEMNNGIGFLADLLNLEGSFDSGTTSMHMRGTTYSLAVNYELQPWKRGQSNFILFLGPQYNFTYIKVHNSVAVNSNIPLTGYQAGAQLTAAPGNFRLSPWYVYSSLSGTASSSTSTGAKADVSVEISSSSLGFDILYVPAALTLSSMYQQQSGSKNNLQTVMIQLAWSFGGSVPNETTPAAHRQDPRNVQAVAAR